MRKVASRLGGAQVFGALALAAAALTGCVAHTRQESAALSMSWPDPPARDLGAYAAPALDYPTVGGDILKGASPADQAKARSEAVPPLDPAPARPRPDQR